MELFYVYVIRSEKCPGERYVGFSRDVTRRLESHNQGKNRYTSAYRPWRLVMYSAFPSETQARAFEKYLKSGSGRAFVSRHFLNKPLTSELPTQATHLLPI